MLIVIFGEDNLREIIPRDINLKGHLNDEGNFSLRVHRHLMASYRLQSNDRRNMKSLSERKLITLLPHGEHTMLSPVSTSHSWKTAGIRSLACVSHM